jgi:hypothetical protein
MNPIWLLILVTCCFALPLRAVETSSGYPGTADTSTGYPGDPYFNGYNAIDPTDVQIANWDNGWGSAAPGVTGWNYVGLIDVPNGYLSGVYLGNGYVLTAAHGGTTLDSFTLDGVDYTPDNSTIHTFTTYGNGTGGQADLILFKLTTVPLNLPSLTLASSLPIGYNATTGTAGSNSVMVGYGFPFFTTPGDPAMYSTSESWGTGNIFDTSTLFSIESYSSLDFDIYDVQSGQIDSENNNNNLFPGDSGGANFIYNPTTQQWELAGINEFVGTYDGVAPEDGGIPIGSGFVQIDDYLDQINGSVPEPSTWLLLPAGLLALGVYRRRSKSS